jgi:hypothetical protein
MAGLPLHLRLGWRLPETMEETEVYAVHQAVGCSSVFFHKHWEERKRERKMGTGRGGGGVT